ncbi:Hypothetical protein NocV09_02301160 [Nannochloropsis oceanica]
MRNGKSSVAGGGSATIDYADVAHTTVTTPVASGKSSSSAGAAAAKRKQQAMGKGGVGKDGAAPLAGAGARGGDKENQRRNGHGGGAATAAAAEDEKKKGHKRAKTQESSHPPPSQSSSSSTTTSVRYPRLNYSEAIPPSDRTLLSPDISDADKLLYLATRVMETDTLQVERILLSTKYNHLSQEMGKYAKIVEKRLGTALARDAKEEKEEVEMLKKLKQQREEEGRICEGLEEEVGRLRKDLAKWEGMEREVMADEGGEGGIKNKVMAARKEEEAREDAAMTASAAVAAAAATALTTKGKRKSSSSSLQQPQQRPFPSPVMDETTALLSQGPAIRQKVLSTATQLLEALEQQLPTWEEKEAEGREKQKELAAAFTGGAFAGLPAVGAPKEAAKKVVGGVGKKK